MPRPTRNASIIASQRITKILKPLRNSFENLTVDEPLINEEPSVPVEVPSVPVEVPSVPVEEPSVPVEEPSVPVEVPSVLMESQQSQTDVDDFSFDDQLQFVWKPLPTSYEHTPEYIGMIRYIRLKLTQAKTSDMVANQAAIQDIFQALIISPTCLMYHVGIRKAITDKMTEMEETIANQWKVLQTQKLDDTLWTLKSELYRNVYHPAIQHEINTHMSSIIQLYHDYSVFLKRNELLQTIHHLRTVMKELELLPGYVTM